MNTLVSIGDKSDEKSTEVVTCYSTRILMTISLVELLVIRMTSLLFEFGEICD